MKLKSLITVIIGTILALAPAANAKVMLDGDSSSTGVVLHTDVLGGNGQPASTSAYATMARSKALNARYGNAVTRLSPAQFKSLYEGGKGLSPATPIRPDILGGNGASPTVQRRAPVSGSGGGDAFPWDATLGASLTAALLLAFGSVAVTRRRHRLGF